MMHHNLTSIGRANEYLRQYQFFAISLITQFEIVRGLKTKNSPKKLKVFKRICSITVIVPLQESTIQIASDIYADLSKRGQLIEDADILIAATALEHNLTLVTNNEKHFARIPSLTIANWTHS